MGGSTGAVWPVRVHSALPVPGAPADVKWQPGPSFRHRAEGVATEQYAMGCDTVLPGDGIVACMARRKQRDRWVTGWQRHAAAKAS